MAINIGLRGLGATKNLYHFTSTTNASSIASSGVLRAGQGMQAYGPGIYTTAFKSSIWARISGASAVEASIIVQGGKALATPWSGTFRILNNVVIK